MGIFGWLFGRKKQAEAEQLRRAQEIQRKEQEEKERREAQRIAAAKEAKIQEAMKQAPGSENLRLQEIQTETSGSILGIKDFTPISKKRFVAFDFETTGLSSADDAIIEIGAVRVENGQITAEFSQLINPGRPVPPEASAVNHITDAMLAGQPSLGEVLPAFLAFAGDDVLAAHNVRFDGMFLAQACMRNRFRYPSQYFDTMSLARYWPEAPNKKLASLIQAAGIQNDAAHRAIGDARAVAELILKTNEKRAESRKKKAGGETA